MATNTTKVVTSNTELQTKPNVASVADTAVYYQQYSVGDTCYYTYSGKQLPCRVVGVNPHGDKSSDGTTVAYTLQGDISTGYPAGAFYGPFKNVSVSSISAR
jgi:hypothetical protein